MHVGRLAAARIWIVEASVNLNMQRPIRGVLFTLPSYGERALKVERFWATCRSSMFDEWVGISESSDHYGTLAGQNAAFSTVQVN